MATYTFYMPTIEGIASGLVPDDISLPTLTSGDVLDLATKTITFSNKSTRKLTDEQVKSYYKHRKVIELCGVGGICDTFVLNEDGGITWTKNRIKVNISELTINTSFFETDLTNTYRIYAPIPNVKNESNGICTHFNVITSGTSMTDTQNICVAGSKVYIRILKSNVPTADLEGCIKYIKDNNPIADLELAIPIITTIPKELMPAILTQLTNTFQFGDAVKPSSVEITVPVDKLAEHTQEIDGLQKTVLLLQQQVAALTTK